jgi:hypothetical protein
MIGTLPPAPLESEQWNDWHMNRQQIAIRMTKGLKGTRLGDLIWSSEVLQERRSVIDSPSSFSLSKSYQS